MTARELLERTKVLAAAAAPRATAAWRWAWGHRTIILAGLVLVLLALNVRSCQRAGRATAAAGAAAARDAGEAHAEAAGVPVVHTVPPAEVVRVVERIKVEDPMLRQRLEEAEGELGKIRLELAAQLRAAPGPAQVDVAKGDQLELSANLVVGRTPEGAHVLEGTLAAARLPGGELVLRQPYRAPVAVAVQTTAAEPCQEAQGRAWRLGGVGGVSGQGWLAGVAYTRRLDVFGWHPELLATAAGGTGGAVLLAGFTF